MQLKLATALVAAGSVALACSGSSTGGPVSNASPTPPPAATSARVAEAEPAPPPVTLIFRIGTQEGNVTFTRAPRARDTMVVLNMAALAGNPAQAAEIRKGSCAAGGTTAFKLTPLQNGQSTTDIAVSRRTLFNGAYAVVVRGVAANSAVTACVNVPARQDAQGGGPHLHEPSPIPAPTR